MLVFTQRAGNNREGVGNTVFGKLKWQFGYGSQRSDCTVDVTAVHRVRTRTKRSACTAAVRSITGFLTVNNVGSNGQYRLSRSGVAVSFVGGHFFHEAFHQVAGDVVHAVVVVTELRIFAFDFKVDGNTVFIANRFHFGVFDGGQRVGCHRQTGDTASHSAFHVTVMQRHQRGFVAVFVVHVVNNVQRGNVLGCQPIHKFVHALKDSVVVQNFVHNRLGFRTDLVFGFFVHAAVDCVQQSFRQVGACAEELHLFADHHRADTAGNGVVVAVEVRTHQIVVFVLDGRSIDGHFGAVLFKALWQLFRPQYGDVRFGRRAHVVQGVQHAEVGTCYQGTAVQAHTADRFGCPNRVA